MWFIPFGSRSRVALLVFTFLFGAYGISELLEASRYGTSLRDGLEALLIATITFALFVLATIVKRRRAQHEEHFDAR